MEHGCTIDPETISSHHSANPQSCHNLKKSKCEYPAKSNWWLIIFFVYEVVVCHVYAPWGQTINQNFSLQVLRYLCDRVFSKWLQKWESNGSQIHHDIATSHSVEIVQQFLATNVTSYSMDMTFLWSFFCFLKVEKGLQSQKFYGAETNGHSTMKWLLIKKTEF